MESYPDNNRRSTRRFSLRFMLLFFLLWMGSASNALAGEFCSVFPEDPPGSGVHVIDGDDPATVNFFNTNNITQITVDTNCTFRNWDPLSVTINFQTPGAGSKPVYLIVFDNVNYTGNMACANIDHKFFVVNSPIDPFSFKCQDLFIPVEAINKEVNNGITNVGIGEPFKYTLNVPVLYDPVLGTVLDSTGSNVDVYTAVITDDLNALGVDVTLLSHTVTTDAGATTFTDGTEYNFNNTAGVLTFDFTPYIIPLGTNVQIELELVANNALQTGSTFVNTASWTFGRVIQVDPDGDGIFEDKFFDPLPGENGISPPLTIGAPNLIVNKTSPDAALNIGVPGSFTIDVQNNGNTDAWSPTIVDVLPDRDFGIAGIAGMCDVIPANITVGLYEANGTTQVVAPRVLAPGSDGDYTLVFDNSTTPPNDCTLTLDVNSTGPSAVVIEPGQRLIIDYNAQLDGDSLADAVDLTNVAGATVWYSYDLASPDAIVFNRTLDTTVDPGTPATADHQDEHTITTGLSGYFFTKAVENITTGDFPATSAAPGDIIRYTLRIFNVDQDITSITVNDDLSSTDFDKTFGTSGYSEVSRSGVTSVSYVGNVLTLTGNDLVNLGDEFVYVFDVRMDASLGNGDTVSNQASLDADLIDDAVTLVVPDVAFSDNPFVNGIDDPLTNPPDPESTDISIVVAGPLLKTGGPATATIGDEFTYRITIPQTMSGADLYDVQVFDDLTANGADLEFVSASVFSGGSWTLTNTGTSSNIVIEDTGAGIDIQAGNQAVIDVTVRVANSVNNDLSDTFTNTATYSYNRINNVPVAIAIGGNSTVTTTTITESNISVISKTASNPTPVAGETITYSIVLTAETGANLNDVFDLTVTDVLDLGLVYAGSPNVTVGSTPGSGVADDNSIAVPDVTGDGITTQQIIDWNETNSNIDIEAGETITITYDVQLLNAVLANQILGNTAIVTWTGIEGANNFERTGVDGPGIEPNDYALIANVDVTTPAIVTAIDKQRTDDTYVTGDDDVRIGDTVEYTVTVSVPENTLGNLTLVDTLPTGLAFESIISINGDTDADADNDYEAPVAVGDDNFSYAPITTATLPVQGQTGAVTWSLGDIANPFFDGNADDFVIVYRARVQNGDVLVQQDNIVLNNEIRLSFDDAGGTNTNAAVDLTTTINVVQPNVTVNKTAAEAGSDGLLIAGEVVTYTVDIVNTGTAPVYDAVVQDAIPSQLLAAIPTVVDTTSITLHDNITDAQIGPALADLNPTDTGGGVYEWNFDTGVEDAYTIPVGQTLRIIYVVTAETPLAEGLTLTNTAEVLNYYSLDDETVSPTTAATSREVYPDPSATVSDSVTLYSVALPSKVLLSPAIPEATIGEQVTYQITVPGTPSASTLYDVSIIDTLDSNLLHLTTDTTITGGTGVTDNSTASGLDIDIDEIAAGTQVVIELHTRIVNSLTSNAGDTIDNTVSYSYAYTDGGVQQPVQTSTDIVTVTITEPLLGINKVVANQSNPGNAPIAGDTLRYTITLPASGAGVGDNFSGAFDVSIIDDLSLGLAYVTNSATLDAAALADPVNVSGGDGIAAAQQLRWSLADSHDIDVAENTAAVITYDVTVLGGVQAGQDLTNSALARWTSIDGVDVNERDGSDGFGVPPNDYETAPQATSVTVPDNNTLTKIVTADSDTATAVAILRVGDTVTYQLDLALQEGTTRSVVVSDVLDTGLVFDNIVSINSDNTADYDPPGAGAGSNFSYGTVTAGDVPTAGDSGTLNFTIGDVVNDPAGDASTDILTIIYQVRVAENSIVQNPSTTLNNTASLNYIDVGNNPVSQPDTANVDVRQPVMTAITKLGNGFSNNNGSPHTVNVATDTVQFTLESCNTNGLAPAYNVQITDVLASQLDESSITLPAVTLNGVLATAGVDYNYTPAAGPSGNLVFDLISPVNPGQCVTVVYDIGFYTNFGPNQLWSNSATLNEYWSLDGQTGQQYTGSGPASFWMTNTAVINPLSKIMATPVSGETTIGDTVIYEITVPGNVPNSALHDVVVSDALHASLQYVSAVDISANGFAITDNTSGNNVSLVISQIPAGQQAVIQLTARVANNASANSGTSFSNTAGYSYANSAGGATIVGGNGTTVTSLLLTEPTVIMVKSVSNDSNPGNPPVAGDILRYTLTLNASGGAIGDDFSDAFDVSIIDDLGFGLAYQAGTTTVGGAGNANPVNVTAGDGIVTEQQLRWSLSDANADIDVAEGASIDIVYDVLVLNNVVAGQNLVNSAVAQWTGLDGVDANERDGSDGFGGTPNDYETAPQATSTIVPDNTAFSKTKIADAYDPNSVNDSDIRIGDTVDYQLDITLQEGTTTAISIADTLDVGLEFASIVSINGDNTDPAYDPPGAGAGSNFSYSTISGASIPAAGATGTLTFDIGDVTNDPAGDASTDTLSIVYRARVMDSTLAQANGVVLSNNAQLVYNGVGPLSDNASVTVRQPEIVVTSKSENDADDILAASETVDYTVLVTNNGDGPAYDTVIVDTLPVGMRDTIPVINSVQINGVAVANITPSYDSVTGILTMDFGAGTSYAIPASGGTLQVVYTATADADLGAGISMTNSVIVQNYYSFDDDAQPEPPIVDTREEYGPTAAPAVLPTLTSPTPGAMLKQSPNEINAANATTVSIGETFTYRITVPETPVNIALHDVRVTDDLSFAAIGADLQMTTPTSFVVSGIFNGTVANTGSVTSPVFEDATNGIDIPANGQLVIDITVEVVDSVNNVAGTTFSNIAGWDFNTIQNDPGSVQLGTGDTAAPMTIVAPDTLILSKSGPANVRVGLPAQYALNVLNDNSGGNASTAWDITISDQLPNLPLGGMCDTAPNNFVAGIYDNAGAVELVALTLNTDYVVSFDSVSCLLTINMQTANASLAAGQRLIISYDGHLDVDTPPVNNIINIAGVTEWFSNDTAGAGATGETRTYTEILSIDPVVAAAVDDFEDAVTAVSEAPEISFQKTVALQVDNGIAGAYDPGDTVRYTITVTNQNDVAVNSFNFTDDLGLLNTGRVFNSLSIVSISTGDPGVGTPVDNSNPAIGSNANGLVDINDLSLGTLSSGNNVATIVFDVTLEPVIDSGTVISNQGAITAPGVNQVSNDPVANPGEDPAVLGDEVPTDFTVTSAPIFQIQKTSQDISGDANVLLAGDTLRYTITVKNIGNEDAVNTLLTDLVPANTTYVADSTTLNAVTVADPSAGVSALTAGMLINAQDILIAGTLRADSDIAANNVATISFDVVINASAVVGAVISNQGFVNGNGVGSGTFPQRPSDDPNTAAIDDPTIDVVGSVPFFDVLKTVALFVDGDGDGLVDIGDTLRYTITATNFGALPVTNTVLADPLPADTTYVSNTTTLNGLQIGLPDDGGVLPLIIGIDISSSDLTGPLPTPGAGILTPGQAAVVEFDVLVAGTAIPGVTVISNQGIVSSNELPDEPTDADGIDSNGDTPTIVTVGAAPLISITKQVSVVGGGTALAGGELEYVVRVTNTGVVDVTNVVITDDLLLPLAGQKTYVANSALINGLPAGVVFGGNLLTADYSSSYGALPAGGVVELRFRVLLDVSLNIGDTVTNTADVSWNIPAITASASVDIGIGGTPGAASLNGQIWHDADFSNDVGVSENLLQGWTVRLFSNNVQLASTLSDANGMFLFSGLAPNIPAGNSYEIRYSAPGAAASTALLGNAASPLFTNSQQRITDIFASSGASVQNLNMPVQPNGVVYNSILRTPVAGVRLIMVNQTQLNQPVPDTCFDDLAQANQVTLANGFYKFDLIFNDPTRCDEGDEYEIQIQPLSNNFVGTTSVIIPPVNPVTGFPQNVIACPGTIADQIPATAQHCENSVSEAPPVPSIIAAAVSYYLKFVFNDVPSTDQIFNNHIPIDPDLGEAVAISKVAGILNVTRSQLVPYTITVTNTLSVRLDDLNVIDNYPAGFKYVTGSSRVDDAEIEPQVNGRQLTWDIQNLDVGTSKVIKLLLIVGSGVGEGEYINTAQMLNTITNSPASGVASATVRVIPDPAFDCTDIIGKVFDDKNMNAYQDDGESGLPGVQVATARGLRVTTDQHGRFHITCAVVPNEVRGSNFIMKLDDRSLPSGYRITTENPRVLRATRGKMLKFNFGAAIHRVVRLDLADGVFEKNSTTLRPQWRSRIEMLIEELQKDASILRLSYLGENEAESDVADRLTAIEDLISERWEKLNCCYKLTIETEVFWRKGHPSDRKGFE